MRVSTWILKLRAALVPDDQLGWLPFYGLGYLCFLYLPAVWDYRGTGQMGGMPASMLWPTLACTALFLAFYFASFQQQRRWLLPCIIVIAVLGYALLPANAFSNTFLIYATAMTVSLPVALRWRLLLAMSLLAIFAAGVAWLHYPPFITVVTLLVATASFFGTYMHEENERKQAALNQSHGEIRRLAALAERERIGRDLHDLLGHTLSLIALKSELAGKLMDHEPAAAAREIGDVSRVARDALAQVRHAVTGIRAAGLSAELASAQLLLESSGVALHHVRADLALSPELETVLALAVRESVTNIQRHARASRASIRLGQHDGLLCLEVVDDGLGGDIVPGNGLRGMRERIEAMAGRLVMESGNGTRLRIELPWTPIGNAAGMRPESQQRNPFLA